MTTAEKEIYEFIKEIMDFKDSCTNSTNDLVNELLLSDRFRQISLRLCLYLPRNSDFLCEIDDLIIPNHSQLNDDSLRLPSGDALSLLVEKSLELYHFLANEIPRAVQFFNGPLTQLIEISPNKYHTRGPGICYWVAHLAKFPFQSWNLSNVCLAVKAMRAVAEKLQKLVYPPMFNDVSNTVTFLSKLINIPLPRCPKKQRIAQWLRRQSEAIFRCEDETLQTLIIKEQRFWTWMQQNPSIQEFNLLDYKHFPRLQLDHLYAYFMSSNDESQRMKLIESFIRGCFETYNKGGKVPIIGMPINTHYLCYMRDLVSIFCSEFRSEICEKPLEKWNELEKCLRGYKREPYISKNGGDLIGVRIWDDHQLKDDSKESFNSESHSEDLTIEKHVFFDPFLNRLELMNIIRTAFWKTAEVLKLEKFPKCYESMVFWRCRGIYPRSIVNEAFGKPGSRSNLFEWIEFTLKMCPFLYLPRGQEHRADDLLKIIGGEQVDKATLEELYFVVNNLP